MGLTLIKRLPESTVSRIASGQIASSPSNVLKELIENAIDAKASIVQVKISSPFSFSVSDNGTGIDYKELPLAVERFTTSKIRSYQDLNNLKTYGFRGEALYAISQVSKLTIKSSCGGKFGGRLVVKAGKVIDYTPIPYGKGTTVEVEELFFNVPVRRKAVGRKEKRLLEVVVETYALSNPNVTFKLNDKVFPASSLDERLNQVVGKSWNPLKLEGSRVVLYFCREKSGIRKVFVNRRPVVLPPVEKLLTEFGVKSYIVFLNLPSEFIDPNVTPTKEKVYISDESYLKELEDLLRCEVRLPKIPVLREKKEINYSTPIEIIGSDGTVLIAHDSEYYYFFDLHLIHERVNYEEILKKLESGTLKKLKLPTPLVLEESLKEKLKKLHVDFEEVNGKLLVREIPELLTVSDLKKLESETVESVASLACRRALKSGFKVVNRESLEDLFNRYLSCKNREFCPHGRPIYYKMKKQKVYSHLGRKLKP